MTETNTHNMEPGRGQCRASFKTPDGQLYYCQRRAARHVVGDQAPEWRQHFFKSRQHLVTWTGTADEETGFCGHARCPGAAR